MRNRRIHDRVPVAFQVCVTVVTNPELTATGEAQDISSSGLGVFLPIQLVAGSLVRVDIADSVLYGFVAHSEEWPIVSKPSFARNKLWSESSPDGDTHSERRFHTGIDVVEVAGHVRFIAAVENCSRRDAAEFGDVIPRSGLTRLQATQRFARPAIRQIARL
jgi:PilZ domain